MNQCRVLFLLFLLSMPLVVRAQENYTDTNNLEETLKNLKISVDDLNVTNNHLTQDNSRLRQEITQLQLKLGQLQEQETMFTQTALKSQDKNEGKAKQIALAQKQLFALDSAIEKISTALSEAKEHLPKMVQDDHNLSEQLNQIQQSMPETMSDVESPQQEAKRMEKINVLKMIDKSHEHQEQLNQAMFRLKPTGKAAEIMQLIAQREALQGQINELQQQVRPNTGAVAVPVVGDDDSIDPKEMQALLHQMTILEKNYSQLRDLWSKMQDKAQLLQMNPAQKGEKYKLSRNLSDLSHQSEGLKGQLQALREQMIELDKRKTRLQKLLTK